MRLNGSERRQYLSTPDAISTMFCKYVHIYKSCDVIGGLQLHFANSKQAKIFCQELARTLVVALAECRNFAASHLKSQAATLPVESGNHACLILPAHSILTFCWKDF
jgi:hypothetical protein